MAREGTGHSSGWRVVSAYAAVCASTQVLWLTYAPIERMAGAAAGTAGALVWLAGNLGGVVVALLVQALVDEPTAAFLSLAAVGALGLPLAARLGRLLD